MSLRGISDRIFPPDPQLHTDRPPPTPLHTGFTAGLSWWTGPDLSEIWELKIYFFSLFGYFGGIFVPLLLLSPTRPPTRSLVSLQIGGVVSHVSLVKYIKISKKQKTVHAKALVRVGLQVCITLETVCSGPCVCRTTRFVWGAN